MNKFFLIIVVVFVSFSCSTESIVNNENEEVNYFLKNDLSKQLPVVDFDNQINGMYHGIIASEDSKIHGQIWVNIANDGEYKAMVETINKERMYFSDVEKEASFNSIYFEGKRGSFTIDVTNTDDVRVSNVLIDDKVANIRLLKERNGTKNRAILGTFVDDLDASFGGTWDLLSTSTQTVTLPTGLMFPFPTTVDVVVNIVSETVVTKTGGGIFIDSSMELFTPGATCVEEIPTGEQAPFFSGEQNLLGLVDINEYALGNQTSTYGGAVNSWSFIFSKAAGDIYYDIDCNEITSGTWSWNSRSGSILLNI